MRNLQILLLTLLFSCKSPRKPSETSQVPKTGTQQIKISNFDTLPNGQKLLDNLDSNMHIYYKEVVGSDTLKGAYITCYAIDDSMRYFYLRHGDTLHLLNKAPTYLSAWTLGTLEKDFNSFFITRIDNGNGVPQTYQVFDKKMAKNILGENLSALNYKYLGDTLFFLYDNHTVNLFGNIIDRKPADSIFLYNATSGRREGFRLPKEIPDDAYIGWEKLAKHSLTISWERIVPYEEGKLVRFNR